MKPQTILVLILLSFFACKNDPKEFEKPQIFEKGKALFDLHCSPCHSLNPNARLTGPVLSCLEPSHTRDWLISFTSDPYKMMKAGDSLALVQWKLYKPSMMNSFDTILSVKEINTIFDYLDAESKNKGLCD